jgi:phage-related protein
MAVPVSALQQIAPSAVIELFQLELNATQHGVNETYYFHAGVNATGSNGDIIWNSQAYMRFPLEAEGFEYSGQGQLPRPKLRISNIFGTITAIILTLPNGLEGAKVTRIRTLGRYLDAANFPASGDILLTEDSFALLLEDSSSILLDPTNPTEDPTAEFPREIYYVDRKVIETRDVIEFELAAVFDLIGVRAPKRQCVSNVCQWKYRGPECGYAGNAYFNTNNQPVATLALDACGKQLSSCELRFEQQYRTGSVTSGSNILTLTQASSFSAGDPVTGFGLPGGTTVSSVSGALVTLNQNAFASTGVVTTGTIQGNYTQIVVSSAAGITPGMAVVGAYLPANCQVVAVSGTTVTLSSTVDLTQFFTVVGSASSQVTVNYAVYFPQGTPLTVGWFLSSSVLPLNRYAQITGIRSVTTKVPSGRNVSISRFAVADISQNQGSNANAAWTFYVFAGIPSATYTFFATNQTYTFRASANLPFGSFPGIGTYTT